MADVVATVKGFGFGWIIALVVLLVCVILAIIGHTLSPSIVLLLIAALALAILL
jgi:hypothetical protein